MNLSLILASSPRVLRCALVAAALLSVQAASANPLGIPNDEYDALVALYNSTNGSAWNNNTNWLTSNTPWYGVIVSGGRVIWLDLYNNNLSGTIPPEIGNLGKLQYLWLDSNRLTGSIPPELGSLQSLQYLWLDTNELTGTIPASLGSLQNLQSLRLENNRLTGPVPSELGSLANLQSLYLSNNDLTGEIPSELGNLTKLRWLYLNNNQLSGAIPSELGNLTELRYLWLSSNRLTGEVPPSFAGLTQLVGSGSSLAYNGLSCSDPQAAAVLNFAAPDWQSTQTVPPSGVAAVRTGQDSVTVSWQPILYNAGDGYYEVGSSDSPGGPYTFLEQNRTTDKLASSIEAVGLPAGHEYLVVRTVTLPHVHNAKNTVVSLPSTEVLSAQAVMPKLLADGESVMVPDAVVTAVFPEFFYIQSPDRSWGIRVTSSQSVTEQRRVRVTGAMTTAASGERYIEASSVVDTGDATVEPLGLTGRALGGGDWWFDPVTGAGQRGVRDGVGPNTIGLLVCVWGTVTASGDGWFYVDDGSRLFDGSGNLGVRVNAPGLTLPEAGCRVSVTGISSCLQDMFGPVNVILPRRQSDIVVRYFPELN